MSGRFDLIEAARMVAQVLDQDDERVAFRAAVGCHIRHGEPAHTYEDDEIVLVFEKNSLAGSIEIKERRDAAGKVTRHHNPAVVVKPDGSLSRYHGQTHDVAEHIRKLSHPLRLLAAQGEDDDRGEAPTARV